MKQQNIISSICFFFLLLVLPSCEVASPVPSGVDYGDMDNWAYFPSGNLMGVDVFFVAPTIFMGDSVDLAMSISDTVSRAKFIGATNMEKGIYKYAENFYAPFYRQVGLYCFTTRGEADQSDEPRVEDAFLIAYDDVLAAFQYYLSISDRPFVLAGFSQGSEHIIHLIKEELSDPNLQERHIATYAIGWRLLQDDIDGYGYLNNAKAADDLGVVVTFNSEAENITSSLVVPSSTLSINPLGWTTDNTFMDSSYHLGACFTNYNGEIENEIPHFSGAYISPSRGTLILPDLSPDDYAPVLGVFPSGVYHLYDYLFFYRNLQENVKTRILKYQELRESN